MLKSLQLGVERYSKQKAKRNDQQRSERWFTDGNVVGVAVGPKLAGGVPDGDDPCLRFFVRRKLPMSRVPEEAQVPSRVHFDSVEGEFLSDLEELPEGFTAHSFQRMRPVRPGAAIAHFRGDPGTAGVLVMRLRTATADPNLPGSWEGPFFLTCAHVALPFGAQGGDQIEQPPDFDGEVGPNVIGALSPHSSPIRFDAVNEVDAALIRVTQMAQIDRAVLGIGAPSGLSSLNPASLANAAAIPLVRSGFATGPGQPGRIIGFKARFPVRFPSYGNRGALFRNVVVYRTHATGGDSGAPVLDSRNKALLGVHFAGSGQFGLMIMARTIFRKLKLRLV